MPTGYELCFIIRMMPKADLVSTIKRTAEFIMNHGGYLRKIESLGTRKLPYRMWKTGLSHREGNYILMEIDSRSKSLAEMEDYFKRDVDLVRHRAIAVKEEPKFECTLEDEMLPPPYSREAVIYMFQQGHSPAKIIKELKLPRSIACYKELGTTQD
ncbi:unnamed protein product [Darwinula stevensoni]|uniref:Small ribosomal subunit protein bS6m n=1 Tax=Darwinula stevensoni TaxID=69355 RepID=A0A7R9AET9_9CRUS|nr:unnamed protein product [Darwinula stevensoni]CAG0902658.1 unnamed protein product [Darwinula stevensoni]